MPPLPGALWQVPASRSRAASGDAAVGVAGRLAEALVHLHPAGLDAVRRRDKVTLCNLTASQRGLALRYGGGETPYHRAEI